MIIPDMIEVNVSWSNILGVGYGINAQIFFMTRGQDAGTFHLTRSSSGKVGVDVGVSDTIVSGWYLGNSRNVTFDGLTGKGIDLSGIMKFVGGLWGSTDKNNSLSWAGSNFGLGMGLC